MPEQKPAPAPSKELSVKEQVQGLQKLLDTRKGAFAELLPKYLTPERLIRCAINAISRNPLLLKCTHESWVLSIMFSAQMGLEPGVPRNGVHLVPFWNKKIAQPGGKTGAYEVVPITDYRGLMSLVRRSDTIRDFAPPEVIYERDDWHVTLGTARRIHHIPCPTSERGAIVAFYSVVSYPDGQHDFYWLWEWEVQAIAATSPAWERTGSPWHSDYVAMGKKTVLRRHCNYLDLSPVARDQIAREEAVERGDSPFDIDITTLSEDAQAAAEAEVQRQASTRTAQVKDKLRPSAPAAASPDPAAREPGEEG
jgi:recombination protein RecT